MTNQKLAIIKLAGHQHLIREGQKLVVNHLKDEIGASLRLDNLLDTEGVELKVTGQTLGKKISGMVFKPKTRSSRRYGHRQQLTVLEVVKIGLGQSEKAKTKPKVATVETDKTPAKKALSKKRVTKK